ncbi:hypothetical protein CW751_05105 [Brumimicrobium salinarum]|uniref:VWFA domain-containing protein n=1 Tax=Brumimicrobium salinarum TaxID=2058658 RepID=A0A2I0R4D2_9FLAO|nr:VWA domain-containing protein [Brumimicrobium salinarum]PKR81435.1 hypothetical protein CW751_05105 [Brumimicrobium salinarum]
MPKREFKYRLLFFLGAVIALEFVFWLLTWQVLNIFGIFDTNLAGEQLNFLNPHQAWWFVCIPLLIVVFSYQIYQRNQLIENLGSVKTLRTYIRPVSTRNVFIRYFFIRNALAFLIFALMQPALGTKTVKGSSSDIELIFTVDVSNSMNTRDIEGGETRLTVAKRVMNQLINESSAGRVGLLVFAGNAYPQLPLTADKAAAKMYIDELNTSIISDQGTHISAALQETSRFFSKEKNKKIMVLITDGEDHEGQMKDAYKAIKDKNIEVFLMGIGTETGGIVPQSEMPNARSLKDNNGRSVVSKVNLKMLEEMAAALNGKVFLSNESFPNLSKILTEFNSNTGDKPINLSFEVEHNRFQWPLILSILFLLMLLGREITLKKENIS